MKAIAIDDEPIALDLIRRHTEAVPDLELLGTFLSSREALAYLQKVEVNLIFLDIKMPDMNGLEVARLINPSTLIIFTTAYSEYAVSGFDLSATDYLLKPITLPRFLTAVQKARERHKMKGVSDVLFVKDGYQIVQIKLQELLFIESAGNYVTFFEAEKRTVVRMKLSEALEKLPPQNFLRIHKCHVINLNKVERIEKHRVLMADKNLSVSDRYWKDLMKMSLDLPK